MVDKLFTFIFDIFFGFWGLLMKGVMYVGLTGIFLFFILAIPLYNNLKKNGL